MGLVIDDIDVSVAGASVTSWRQDSAWRLVERQRGPRRNEWIRAVILHTTKGIPYSGDPTPQTVRSGHGPSGNAKGTLDWWNRNDGYGSAHVIIDADGRAYCVADLAREVTWHATSANDVSVGIEIWQASDASIYQAQIATCIALCDVITVQLGIQQQIHLPYRGAIARLESGAKNTVGVFGHRDQTRRRGKGDPGDAVMRALKDVGYEAFDFSVGDDLVAWRDRQRQLGVTPDGIPGPITVQALHENGYGNGLWTPDVTDEGRRLAVWEALDGLWNRHGSAIFADARAWLLSMGDAGGKDTT